MSLSDWIISLGTGLLAIIIGVASYFAQKWIGSVDETLKEHANDFKALTKQISTLEQKQTTQTENLSKTVQIQLSNVRFPHTKVDEIREEIGLIKSVIQDKVLPEFDRQAVTFGKVLVIEQQIGEQNAKLLTMFNALKVMAQQQQKRPTDQK